LCRANSSFKRSRSPDPFTKGDTSNQGSQIDGRFSRRCIVPSPFHPYQDNVNIAMEIKKGLVIHWRVQSRRSKPSAQGIQQTTFYDCQLLQERLSSRDQFCKG